MAEQNRNTRNTKSTKVQPVNDYGRIQPQAPELEEAVPVSYTHLDVYKRQEDNLVAKAYSLLDKEFHLPPVEIHLYKHIPSGAGLGGGSCLLYTSRCV